MLRTPLLNSPRPLGFTLVELVMVIAVSGVVAVMVSSVMGHQFSGYSDMETRTKLIQVADSALQLMTDDIRGAVPNSVRIRGNYIEMVPVQMAATYRDEQNSASTADPLDFTVADTGFDVYADLVNADTSISDGQIVIYNTGITNAGAPVYPENLYATNTGIAHVISGVGLTIIDNGAEDSISLNAAHQFARRSPYQKLYLVQGALTYHCDPVSGTLKRFAGYPIEQTQPIIDGVAPLIGGATAANNITGCSMRYSAGTLSRNAIISLVLELGDGNQSTTLMRQVQISNVP